MNLLNLSLRPAALIFGLIAASGAAFAAPMTADSRIDTVTVYSDRAVVGRTASVDLPAGTTEVLFEKLPASVLADSVQVSGRGNLAATILDVTTRSRYVEFTPNERVRALEDKLRELGFRQRAFDDQLGALHAQEATLVRIETAATQPPTKDAPRLSLEEATKLLSFVGEQRAKFAEQQQAIERQRDELVGTKSAAEKQLGDLRGSGGGRYQDVVVRLSAEAPGKLLLALHYAVPDAHWSPQYDARVKTDSPTVQFSYLGVVRQNTGEDWNNVQLTLSTAHPALGGGPGNLNPWWLDPFRRQVLKLQEEDAEKRSLYDAKAPHGFKNGLQLAQGYAANEPVLNAAMPAPIELVTSQTEVAQLATSATFRVPAPATVLSDNTPQKVPVATLQLPGTFEYRTTPKLIAAAFLYAKLENHSEVPLLAGKMNVFLDDTFVAASSMATVMAGEKFELALGADEAISVKRQVNRTFSEETGLLTKGQRVTYDFTFTVQNHKMQTATLLVTDQLPVSRDEKILVKQLAPQAAEIKPAADGTIQWKLALAPNEKKELPLRFSIEHPADVTIVGLN